MARTHALFEHDADFGVIGRGTTIEEAFVAAAEATFGIMIDTAAVQALETVPIEFEEADVELALVTWLNALLGHARDRGVVLGRFELRRDGAHWRGSASGEPWRSRFRARHGGEGRDAHDAVGAPAGWRLGSALHRGRLGSA